MKRTMKNTDSNSLGQSFLGAVTNLRLMVFCFSMSQLLALASVIH